MIVQTGYITEKSLLQKEEFDLVLYCFDRKSFSDEDYEMVKSSFLGADIIGFSTSGHYIDSEIQDDKITYAGIKFEKSQVECITLNIDNFNHSKDLGEELGTQLNALDCLKGICIISDGGMVNGTELIEGIGTNIDDSIPVFGGMAGDQARFEKTFTGLNDFPTAGNVTAIAFSGDDIEINTAFHDGWTDMGMDFKITESEGNILKTIDNKCAYDILKELLTPKDNEEFNKNTLHYPFSLITDKESSVIRTPILVNHQEKTLTYAGDMPVGSKIKLMKSNTMDLLDSAMLATSSVKGDNDNTLLFAISCVGRRVVLGDMAKEEYEEIANIQSENTKTFGFYSYGEFARNKGENSYCNLHNQTFTIASISEK